MFAARRSSARSRLLQYIRGFTPRFSRKPFGKLNPAWRVEDYLARSSRPRKFRGDQAAGSSPMGATAFNCRNMFVDEFKTLLDKLALKAAKFYKKEEMRA